MMRPRPRWVINRMDLYLGLAVMLPLIILSLSAARVDRQCGLARQATYTVVAFK
jgi:hypothetical protein